MHKGQHCFLTGIESSLIIKDSNVLRSNGESGTLNDVLQPVEKPNTTINGRPVSRNTP